MSICLLAMSSLYAQEAKDLFNGKDLTGWSGSDQFWSVKDGVIVGSTMENKTKGNTFLIWEGEVEDFHLTFEAKVTGKNNSGVQYRSKVVKEFVMAGYQCDIHPKPEYTAMIYGEKFGKRGIIITRGQKMEIDEAGKKTVISKEKAEPVNIAEWNKYEVICKGNHIIQKLNGKVAIDLKDNHKDKMLKGKIGLQLHAGAPMKAEFRNIKLIKQ